jgi:hypothetical protein
MSNKVKIALAVGLQLAVIGSIGSIGDFVEWPFIKEILIGSGIAFGLAFVFVLYDAIKA